MVEAMTLLRLRDQERITRKRSSPPPQVKGPIRCHKCQLKCRDAPHYLSHRCEPKLHSDVGVLNQRAPTHFDFQFRVGAHSDCLNLDRPELQSTRCNPLTSLFLS